MPIYPEKMNRGRSDKQFLIRVTYSKFDIFKESRDFILITYVLHTKYAHAIVIVYWWWRCICSSLVQR